MYTLNICCLFILLTKFYSISIPVFLSFSSSLFLSVCQAHSLSILMYPFDLLQTNQPLSRCLYHIYFCFATYIFLSTDVLLRIWISVIFVIIFYFGKRTKFRFQKYKIPAVVCRLTYVLTKSHSSKFKLCMLTNFICVFYLLRAWKLAQTIGCINSLSLYEFLEWIFELQNKISLGIW